MKRNDESKQLYTQHVAAILVSNCTLSSAVLRRSQAIGLLEEQLKALTCEDDEQEEDQGSEFSQHLRESIESLENQHTNLKNQNMMDLIYKDRDLWTPKPASSLPDLDEESVRETNIGEESEDEVYSNFHDNWPGQRPDPEEEGEMGEVESSSEGMRLPVFFFITYLTLLVESSLLSLH